MGKIWGVLEPLYKIIKHLWWAIMTVCALMGIVPQAVQAAGVEVPAFSPNSWTAIGVAIGFLAIGLYVMGLKKENMNLTRRLDQIISSLPNIELYGEPYVDERIIRELKLRSDIVVSPPKPYFTHVKFCNNPQFRTADARAKDVIAEITFFISEGETKILNPFYGRWCDTKQPSYLEQGTPMRELHSVDFEESGLEHELDIALKYQDEEVCYAFNNTSYSAPMWKNPNFELHGERFQVRVRLKGQMVDKEWWFTLHNLGRNQGLKIEVGKEAIDRQADSIGELG